VERVARERQSFDILSVKKDSKLSASEVDEEECNGDADFRCNSLLTVCHRFHGKDRR